MQSYLDAMILLSADGRCSQDSISLWEASKDVILGVIPPLENFSIWHFADCSVRGNHYESWTALP